MHSLINNFETYFPRQQAKDLQSKLWILNIFDKQHPPEHLGTNLKNDLCHQPFISRIKHTDVHVRALDSLRKNIETDPLPREALVGLAPKMKPPH